MTAWKDISWFEETVQSSGTLVLNKGTLPTSGTYWNSTTSFIDPTSGGSGSTPAINIGTDLCIRTRDGQALTTETGEALCVNGE